MEINSFQAVPYFENHDPDEATIRCFQESAWWELQVGKQDDALIFKLLMSKLLYTSEKLTKMEICSLFIAREKLIEKLAQHRNLREKYFLIVRLTSIIFKDLEKCVVDQKCISDLKEILEPYFSYGRKMLSASLYYGIKNKVHLILKVKLKRRQPKKFPEKRHIGVGYKDKGSRKDLSQDGSPSWEEVASDFEYQEQFVNYESLSQRISILREQIDLHQMQYWRRL